MRVRTLGGLALEGSELTRPQPLLLLTYVALEGPKGRRELADLFFMHTADPRDSLSSCLRYLRTEAPGAVDAEGDEVKCLIPCDAVEFLEVQSTLPTAESIDRFRGVFLEGLDLSLGPELEEWVFETRERLARGMRSTLLDLSLAALDEDEPDLAREMAESAYRVPGAPEAGPEDTARLLSILERVGSRWLNDVRALADDIGIARSQPLVSPHGAGGSDIPAPKTTFVGREEEIERIRGLIVDERARLTTITGVGGIGKTRLALEVGRRLAQDADRVFPDGILYVPLERAGSSRDALGRLGIAIGVPPPAGFDIRLVAAALASKKALIILDNLEHLDPVELGLGELLETAAQIQVLATSRNRLRVSGEYLIQLGGLETPSMSRWTKGRSDAAALFLDRAHRVRPSRTHTREDLDAIESICTHLGGYPLGIELAASMTRALSPHDVLVELHGSYKALEDERGDVPDRHHNLQAVFEPSLNQLPESDRTLLVRLSVFRGAFDHRAAREVADATVAALLRFVDHSMLGTDGSAFVFHPVQAEFLRDTAPANPEELRHATTRLVAWVDRFLESGADPLHGVGPAWFDRLETHVQSIVHAIGYALERGETERAIRMTRRLVIDGNYLSARGADDALLDLLERAVDVAEQQGDLASAHDLATKLGNAQHELLGQLDRAYASYSKALALAEREGLRGRQAIVLALLGALASKRGQPDATELLRRARAIAEEAGDDIALSHVLQNWSYVAGQEDVELLFAISREAVDVALRVRASREPVPLEVDQKLFFSLLNLGEAHRLSGDLAKSLECRRSALEIAQERDQSLWAAYALEEIGSVHHQQEQRDRAGEAFDEAIALYRAAGARYQAEDLMRLMQEGGYRVIQDHEPHPA